MISRRTFLLAPLSAALLGRAHGAERKPNVVLVIASRWRATAVPWAGDPNVHAPNLARFGSEAVTFSRAYSCYPRAVPAQEALLKGRLPKTLTGDAISIGSVLQSAGYRSAALAEAAGTSRLSDEWTAFLSAAGDQPFYAEWSFDAAGASGRAERPGQPLFIPPNVAKQDESRARDQLAEFYGRAAARDRDLGTMLAALDRAGLAANTIVIFTSDRGEQMGSHGVWGDDAPYEESVRIPLAIRFPRAIPRARESDMLVSHIDVMPTVLGFCGVAAPETVQGRDLSALIEEQKGERPDAVYAEGRRSQPEEWRMLVHGFDKLVTDAEGAVTHLYNLADDPYETNDLAAVSAEQLKRDALSAMLQLAMRKLNRVDPSGLKLR